MEEEIPFPPLENVHGFMLITPVPKILEDINFVKIFGDSDESQFLHEARKELKLAMVDHFGNIKLCLNTAQTYYDRLINIEAPFKKKSGSIEWGRIFTDLGKHKIKIKIRNKSHLKVEIYMVIFIFNFNHNFLGTPHNRNPP